MISPRKTIANAKTYQIFNKDRRSKLRLDLNENAWGCSPKVLEVIENVTVEDISLYPEYGSFLKMLSQHYNVSLENVIISNGADDSIRCVFDCLIEEDDEILLPVPNYGMFDIFGRIRGAKIIQVLYNKDFTFPTNKILELVSEKIKLIIIVNPANPLGTTIPDNELIKILKKANESFILLDETYFHFVGKSYVELIKQFDNLIIVQTFSKAYGLTGLRLGVLFSNPNNINKLAKVNLPFAVNSIALKAASVALDDQDFIQQVVENVAIETKFLQKELDKMGLEIHACRTNFLLMKIGDRADQVFQELQDRDILLRNLNKYPLLKGYLRISIGKREDNLKLLNTLRQILPFEAILFDMDGVLVDVSNSYRLAIKNTAEYFIGETISPEEISTFKDKGGLNNDWYLTQEIVRSRGKHVEMEQIIEKFQQFYLGDNYNGFIQNEKWLLNLNILNKLKKNYKLGIVTGRPRPEAEFVLKRFGVTNHFDVLITMGDIPSNKGKPDPFSINMALEKLNAKRAIYLGDNIDDMKAARAANIIAIGVLDQVSDKQHRVKLLEQFGAKTVLGSVNEVSSILM